MRPFPKGAQVLFQYHAGQDFAALGGRITRTTQASYIDGQGRYRVVLAGQVRDAHFVNGDGPLLLIEPLMTQLVATPDTPNSWTAFGTPVVTTGIVDPWGGTNAVQLQDDDGAAREGKQVSVTYTADGTKAVVVAVRAGTAAQITCGLRDATAGGVDRHAVTVTWQTGTLAPVVATLAGAGTIFPSQAVYDSAGNLWWLIRFSATGVVAANSNSIHAVVNAAASTGTFYLAGANTWNSDQPWSWQGATFATRNADQINFLNSAPTPRAMTILVDYVDVGSYTMASSRLFQMGNGATAPRYFTFYNSTTGTLRTQHENGTSTVNSTPTPVMTYGDKVLARMVLDGTGAVLAGVSKNGAAEVLGSQSAANTLAGAWSSSDTTLHVAHSGAGGNNGGIGLRQLLIVAGVQSLATMTYDFLAAITAESAEFVHLLEMEFSGGTVRFCTGVQDLLWNAFTWDAVGGLLQFGGVEETTDAKAQGVDIKLSGVDQTVAALLLTNQYRGRAVKIYRAHLNKTSGQVVGEPLLLFQGLQLSPYNIEEQRDFGGGTVQISTRFSGYFGVSRVRGIQTNLVSHQHHFNGDTFFQYTAQLTNAKVYWGTATPASITRGGGGTSKDDNHQEPWK